MHRCICAHVDIFSSTGTCKSIAEVIRAKYDPFLDRYKFCKN